MYIITRHLLYTVFLKYKEDTEKTDQDLSRPTKSLVSLSSRSRKQVASEMTDMTNDLPDSTTMDCVEHSAGALEFSAYHFHHNRVPFYILFIRKGNMIYVEKIDEHSHRNKYVDDVVMPIEVLESNKSLKKYYDMAVMLVNTDKTIYYDPMGFDSKRLISTYDTESEDEGCEDEDSEGDGDGNGDGEIKKKEPKAKAEPKPKVKRPIRHWCINSDIVWKNIRVSTPNYYNCYYNIDPFAYEYNVGTDKEIEQFITNFDAWGKYNNIPQVIEDAITANYNYYLRLVRT